MNGEEPPEEGGGDGKTRSARGRTAKKGRIDKASWNFFNPSPPARRRNYGNRAKDEVG